MRVKRIISFLLAITIVFAVFSLEISASAASKYEDFARKLDKTVYSGELGAVYSKSGTRFRVWAPTADGVEVRLYKTGTSKTYFKSSAMSYHKENGVWSTGISGDLKNIYYTYKITRGKKSVETTDIYAKACGINGKKSMVVDLSATNPKGWENDRHVTADSSADAIIWEVQISDFSSSESSGVSKKNRGKYLAFTETGTTVDSVIDAPSTCVDYLKEMGVNYVHINPFYDFGSIDESDTSDSDKNFNWGYDPVNYNCPEGSYSSDPSRGAVRIKECKQMIQALHKAGIGVIMDVVYNHTHKWKNSAFELTVPNYYYRRNPDGTFSNGSGCGNDTASEHKMFRKFMTDSVLYWAEEYHIDGFRFDLMGLHDVDTMNGIRAKLDALEDGEKLLMYGEPWELQTTADDGTVLATTKNMSELSGRIGAFDDTYRDALKGSTSGADQGFIQSGSNKSNLRQGISGQNSEFLGWAKAPTQVVTYGSCHDNLTLYDKLVKSVKGDKSDYYTRYSDLVAMNKLAGAITYTSQGTAFMLAGEEFCRTKNGDENSYKSGVKLNQLDWGSLYTYGDVADYYKGLIELRRGISAFTDPTHKTGKNMNFLTDLPDGVLGYTVEDEVYGTVYVLFNYSESEAEVKPDGVFVQLVDEKQAGMQSLGTVNGRLKLPAHSAAVLVSRDNYAAKDVKNDVGRVTVRYTENGEVFKSYILSGKRGESFSVEPIHSVLMDYNIKKTTGDSGTFSDSMHYCDFECEKYDGDYSSVTFHYVDSETEKSIANSVILTNRMGQPYETLSIPSVDGYSLNLDRLPKNGCGVFGQKDKTVVYKYNKRSTDDPTCKVNIIYMSTDGKVLSKDTLTGAEGASYTTSQIEFDNYAFKSSSENASGVYSLTEQNVLCLYDPVSLANILKTVFGVAAIVIVALGFIIIYRRRRKRELMSKLDIG